MKYLLLTLILALAFSIESKAQTDTLVINLKNSQVDKIAVSQIMNIRFENLAGVDEQQQQSNNIAIKGNYPNPFAEQTTIEFETGLSGNVEIIIYDNSGVQIKVLKCENCQSGRNIIQWNCLDKNNNQVPSGVYFYEVHLGKDVQSRKMIVIK